MKEHYKIVGYEMIEIGKLQPHPDVQLPMDEEDSAALSASMEDKGILQPLIVSAKAEGGKRFIYEGVNRWKLTHFYKSSRDGTECGHGKEYEVPCILVECDNPRELALTFLGVGRKRSTGQRIMAFLELHKKEVLKVAAIVNDGLKQNRGRASAGHVTDGKLQGNLVNFTAEAIAEKLHVSAKDVGLGIELLRCIEEKKTASWDRGNIHVAGRDLDMEQDSDKDYHKALKKVHLGLLAGSTPIRRWKPAVGGLSKTDDKPRNPTDHGKLGYNAILTMKNTIKNWDKVSPADKQNIAREWEELRHAAQMVHLD